MKRITIFMAVLLALVIATGVSAQIEIRSADGTDLPTITYCGDTFTVQIAEDGIPMGAGTNVAFVLASIGGDPIYVATDSNGKVKYKPLVNGILTIRVLDGTTMVAETTVTVEDEPWVPEPTLVKKVSGGNGGAIVPGIVTSIGTVTLNDTTNSSDIVPVQTIKPVVPVVIETTEVETPTSIPKAPKDSSIPGFSTMLAIVAIFGVVFVIRMKR